MNKFYGGGGVESRHAGTRNPLSRSSALPASTPYGSQPGGDPLAVPRIPVGCHPYEYEQMMDGREPSDDYYGAR